MRKLKLPIFETYDHENLNRTANNFLGATWCCNSRLLNPNGCLSGPIDLSLGDVPGRKLGWIKWQGSMGYFTYNPNVSHVEVGYDPCILSIDPNFQRDIQASNNVAHLSRYGRFQEGFEATASWSLSLYPRPDRERKKIKDEVLQDTCELQRWCLVATKVKWLPIVWGSKNAHVW